MSEVAALRDLVELRGEKSAGAKDPQLPYIGLEHVAQNSGEIIGRPPSASSVSINSVFASGDILFGKLRPNLRKCAQATFAGYCSTDLLVFRAKSGTDPSFAARTLQSETVFGEAIRTAGGTKMPRTSWSALEGLPVFHPPLRQQRGIAKVLDAVDAAIRSTETLIAKLEQMKHGLLHDLLTRGIDENGELRDSERHPEQFMVSKLGLVPKQWRVLSLQEASASIPGSTTIGPFGSNLVASDYRTSGVPVVFVRDIRADGFKWISDVYVSVDKAAQLAAHVTLPGDILATKMGLPPCIAALHPDDARPAVITADVIRLRPDIDVVDAGWLVASINSETVRKQVRAITGGVTRPKVTLRDFRQILIAVPPITEQLAIRDVLTWEDLLRQQADAQVSKVRLLKRGLMEDLLIGRVRVTVDEEEPK